MSVFSRFNTFFRRREASTEPEYAIAQERPNCPFYGFERVGLYLIDAKNNACALSNPQVSCMMESNGRDGIQFKTCGRIPSEHKDQLIQLGKMSHTRIFPAELDPGRPWQGVSLTSWLKHFETRRQGRGLER